MSSLISQSARSALALGCVLVATLLGRPARAELGNLQFEPDELWNPIAYFDRTNMPCTADGALCPLDVASPTGANTALVLHGYLIVMGSFDSGRAGGPLHVFDVSNPRAPVRVRTVQNAATNRHRELHAMPVAQVDGRSYLALPTRPQGVNIWDFTDPLQPALASKLELSSRGGDYDNAVWQLSWSWPYLFAGGTGDGVYVIDTTDPRSPVALARIPTTHFGGTRVGSVTAVGNLLVASNMDQSPARVTVLDVTDPTRAFQLAAASDLNRQYSSLVLADRVFTIGSAGVVDFWSFDGDGVELVSTQTIGSAKGGYCTYQDHFLFCGQSEQGLRKIDVADPQNAALVGSATVNRPRADMDFATVLGNLVFLGNDHGSGSAFVPHQTSPDTTPPAILRSYPADGAQDVPPASRLTVFLSDVPEFSTVDETSLFLRDVESCRAVEGVRSYSSFNALSFGPKQPLLPDTTYELVLLRDGIRDLAGNAVADTFVARFSTGPTIRSSSCDDEQTASPPDEGAGGSGGNGGSSGGGAATQAGGGDAGESGGAGGFRDGNDSAGSTDGPLPPLHVELAASEPLVPGEHVTYRARVAGGVGDVSYKFTVSPCTTPACSPSLASSVGEYAFVYDAPGHYSVSVTVEDESGARAGETRMQTVHAPLAALQPASSTTIAYDSSRDRIWNVNQDSATVTATDAGSGSKLFEAAAGASPTSLALAPDGSLWVANQDSDTISVLSSEDGSELGRIELGYGSAPRSVVFGPESGMAYVTLFGAGKLVEIDPRAQTVTGEVVLGPTPAGLAVNQDGRIFVTRFVSPAERGEIWEVASDSLSLVRTIELPFDPGADDGDPTTHEDPDSESAGRGVPNYLFSIVISPDGTQAWVLGKKDNTARGPQRDGRAMNSDSFARAVICVIDLASSEELVGRRIDIDNRALPVAAAFSPLGDYVYVVTQANDFVGVFDAYRSSQHAGGIENAGSAPDGLLLLPDRRLVVNGYLSRNLLIYDLEDSLESGDHYIGDPLAVVETSEEPLEPEIAWGKRIFYNASDPRMSDHGYLTCAVCHYAGSHDGRVWDLSDRGEGLRNTKSLAGALGAGRLHWSANFDEVQDFERDIRESQGGKGFLSDGDFQRAHREGPLDEPIAGLSPELDALAAYVGSLRAVGRSPYRNADGSRTERGVAGRRVFERAGCTACHGGPNLTDSSRGRLHDVGTLRETSGGRLHGDLTGLDTPSLRGLWLTGPYLHDGRADTVRAIFTRYNSADLLGVTSSLSSRELDELEAYLLELDDQPEPGEAEVAAPAEPPARAGLAPVEAQFRATRPLAVDSGCSLVRQREGSSSGFLLLALLAAVSATRRRKASRHS